MFAILVTVVVIALGPVEEVGLEVGGEGLLRRGVGIDELPIDKEDDILGKRWEDSAERWRLA